MSRFKILLGATICLSIQSCTTKVPLSSQTMEKYQLSENDLLKLEYYTSDDIVLYKTDEDSDPIAYQGMVYQTSGLSPNRIVLRGHTPGIAKDVQNDQLVLSFESMTSGKLVFGSSLINKPFSLMAKRWNGNWGYLDYDNREYACPSGSGETFIYFKSRDLKRIMRSRRLNGRKL